jgi:hypothetical protein
LPPAHDQLEFFFRFCLHREGPGRWLIKRKNPLHHTRLIGGKNDLP